jgi:uncharacterized protein YggE
MDGNKTGFVQLETALKLARPSICEIAGQQVFPSGAFLMFAAQFSPRPWARKRAIRQNGRGKMTKRLFATTLTITLFLCAATFLHAQTATSDTKRATRITVGGDAIVQAQPDTAILTISVVTQARRAIDAQQENATKTDAVVQALKAAAGPGAEIKTSGYSVQPQRVYRENQPPTISGYEARNSVTVTISDLKKVGTVIDASSQAGANDIAGIAFTLRQDRPARDRALLEATREAMSKAEVIASALGRKVTRIVEVQEEGFVRPPQPVYQAEAFMVKRDSVATPIEVGALDITSRVLLIAEVE